MVRRDSALFMIQISTIMASMIINREKKKFEKMFAFHEIEPTTFYSEIRRANHYARFFGGFFYLTCRALYNRRSINYQYGNLTL